MRSMLLAAGLLIIGTPMVRATDIVTACETDIATYCEQVAPGNGRVLSCLYAHEDLLSEACDAATSESSDLLDFFFSRLQVVAAACGEDAVKHCSEVSIGGGRLFACLKENEATLSPGCAELVGEVRMPQTTAADGG